MNNWITVKLGDIVKAGEGKIHTGPFGSQLHASDYVDSGIPCIMPANMRDGYVDLSNISFIKEKDAQRLSKYIVQEGDIVYSRRGDVTQKALIRPGEAGYFCGTGCLLLRPGKMIDSEFLTYYLSTNVIKNWIVKQAVGATMPNLNTAILSSVPFTGPSNKFEQQKIASVLSFLNNKILLNNKIYGVLEEIIKLIYDYWFIQFDFPNINGKPYKSSGGKMVYNDELNREIPDGWVSLKLDDIILRSGTGLNPRQNFRLGEGSNYYVTIKNIKNGKIIFDDKCDRISDDSLNIINKRSDLRVGDVLFTSIEPVGVTYLIQEKPLNWNINESVFTLRANPQMATSEFLYQLLSSEEMKIFTRQSSSGSIHKGIRHGVLKNFNLPYAGKSLIDSYTEIVKPLLKKQHMLNNENQRLLSIRDWLLPMLMNGQVLVK